MENSEDTARPTDNDSDTDSPLTTDRSIVVSSGLTTDILNDKGWGQIVDAIVDELTETDHLPDKVIQATELLLAGYPIYKAARKLNVSPKTIRRWLSTYPTMAAVIAHGKGLLTKWRMAQLEQQFLSAIERSQEVLDISLDGTVTDEYGNVVGVNPKVLTVVAAQARYIIGLFAGQKVDVTVTHELGDTVMKAQQDALDYIAQQLIQQRDGADVEPIEATFRVVDAKVDDKGPMLDEDGEAPFGKMGVLDRNDDGTLCHICGSRNKDHSKHVLSRHNMGVEEYETLYLLDQGSLHRSDRE